MTTSDQQMHELFDLERLVDVIGAVVVWEYDADSGTFTYVSKAAESLLGFPTEDWRLPGFWLNHVHPEDLAWVTLLTRSRHTPTRPYDIEYRMLSITGATVWVREVVSPDSVPEDGGPTRGALMDITPRREAELATDDLASELETLFEMLKDTYFRVDSTGTIRDCRIGTDWAVTLHANRLAGTGFHELLEPEDHAASYTAISVALQQERPTTERFRVLIGDDHRMWDCRYLPVGKDLVTIIARDVTDHHFAETARRDSHRLLSSVLETIELGILIIGDDDEIVLANSGAENLFGYSPGTLLGVSMDKLHGDRVRYDSFVERYVRNLHMGESYTVELPLVRSDQTTFDAEVSIKRVLGRTSRLSVVRDVSERNRGQNALRESESRLRSFVNHSPTGTLMYSLDPDGILRLTEHNHAASSILDVPLSTMIGLPIAEVFPALVGTGVIEDFVRVVRDNTPLHVEDFPYEADGVRSHFEFNAFQVSPTLLAVLFQDITASVRSTERLRGLSAELMNAEYRERRRLAEELHDRVSQSLAVARMRLRMAEDDASPDAASDIAIAASLIDEAISQSRAITTELSPPILHELGLASGIEWLCDNLAAVNSLACRTCIDASIGDRLSEESRRLMFRGAREFLANAARHAEPACVEVTARVGAGYVALTVSDDGHGFDTTRPHDLGDTGGFGLLSIREGAASAGGELRIDSKPGAGTGVELRLPFST